MNLLQKLKRTAQYGVPGRRPHRPLLLIFHITTRCNLACRHCGDDVWGDPRNDLSLEEIARFCAGLGKVEALALGGGEPFLRQDIVSICRLFIESNGVRSISIPSNGLATDQVLGGVRSILEACPGVDLNLMLSLDGYQETHDAIRRTGSFDRVLHTASRLKELSGQYPQLSLSFNSTINNLNWQELPSLARFLDLEFGATLEFNVLAGNPRDPSLTVPPREQLETTVDGILEVSRKSGLRRLHGALYRDVLLKTNFEGRQVVPCRAGSLVCLVDANGDVRSCPVLPPLGNLRNASFGEIWEGERARQQFLTATGGGCACNNDCFIRVSLSNYWRTPLLMLGRLVTGGR